MILLNQNLEMSEKEANTNEFFKYSTNIESDIAERVPETIGTIVPTGPIFLGASTI